MTAAETIQRARREILRDVHLGVIPSGCTSFAQLHDHVDANGYGGAFEESAHDVLDSEFWNAVQNSLDQWIKAGGLRPPREMRKVAHDLEVIVGYVLADDNHRRIDLNEGPYGFVTREQAEAFLEPRLHVVEKQTPRRI